jgi:hypothetical protein
VAAMLGGLHSTQDREPWPNGSKNPYAKEKRWRCEKNIGVNHLLTFSAII